MILPETKFFRIAMWVLIIFTIILVGREISFIFRPVVILVQVMFLPVMFALIFFYLLSPVVDWLSRRNIPRTLAVLLVYTALFTAGTLMLATLGSMALQQLLDLGERLPDYAARIEAVISSLDGSWLFRWFQENGTTSLAEWADSVSESVLQALPSVGTGLSTAFGAVTSALLTLILTPLILFYLLKDEDGLRRITIKYVPKEHRKEASDLLRELDQGLSAFIQGQIIVSVSVGLMILAGFSIIRLEHALLFALFAMLTNLIPYIGPIISTIPALIVGFLTSAATGLQVLVVVLIVQQFESFVLTPQIMGKKLFLHPLTVVTVLILMGSLGGLLGVILAIPSFIIIKIVVTHFLYCYQLYARKDDATL